MKLITSTLLTLLLIISGCYTAKKADKAIDKAQRNYPEVVANKARSLYPCTTVRIDTAYFQHDTIIEIPCPESWPMFPIGELMPPNEQYNNYVSYDTTLQGSKIQHSLDSIPMPNISNTKRIAVPVRVKIPTQKITEYVEDSAKIYVLNSELKTAAANITRIETKLQDTTESRNKWRKWCVITWVLIGLYLLVVFALPKLLNR